MEQRRKPRLFKWSQVARDVVRSNLNASGAELQELIDRIADETGNPRDACLRFARQLGLEAKRAYRRWSKAEVEELERQLELHRVRTVAIKLRRTPAQIYTMMHRMGISSKTTADSLSMYALARLLHKRPQVVRKWIVSGELKAENEGTEKVPRFMISQGSLRTFCKKHRELIAAGRLDRERLKFIFEYIFPRSHQDLLAVRESKKEREAFRDHMGEQ
jgi:hypothetical protein